jgi:hypothetical protein
MANYSGKNPNTNAYIKNFIYGPPANLWKTQSYTTTSGYSESVISPASINFKSLYIPGDLFVDGSIVNPSDINLKKNIASINVNTTDKLMNLKPSEFVFKEDPTNHIHYGFIAQELENEYPELVQDKPGKMYYNFKAVNYLEIIPLLVHKIQLMQKEIDELKEKVNHNG